MFGGTNIRWNFSVLSIFTVPTRKLNAYISLLFSRNDKVTSLGSILPYYFDFFPTTWLWYSLITYIIICICLSNYNLYSQSAYWPLQFKQHIILFVWYENNIFTCKIIGSWYKHTGCLIYTFLNSFIFQGFTFMFSKCQPIQHFKEKAN